MEVTPIMPRMQESAHPLLSSSINTPVGFVSFVGEACPWDRESVRALCYVLTGHHGNGSSNYPDIDELTDLADTTVSSNWHAVASRILERATSIANAMPRGIGSEQTDRALERLYVILAKHENTTHCAACGQSLLAVRKGE